MAIKRVTYDTLNFLEEEVTERYEEKGDMGAVGGVLIR